MENAYQDPKAAANYLAFLDSVNGEIQQQILFDAIATVLPSADDPVVLDAGCGSGWLAGKLISRFQKVHGCDASPALLAYAKQHYPEIGFSQADLQKELPYSDGSFDIALLNMAAPDLPDLGAAIKNLSSKLKPGGKLIMTVPNPKLTYPAAVWKRSLPDLLLRRKPHLIITGYSGPTKIDREFGGQKIASYFYTLDDYKAAAQDAGLQLARLMEIKSQKDSVQFDLNYQMFRYPLILLLEFQKQAAG